MGWWVGWGWVLWVVSLALWAWIYGGQDDAHARERGGPFYPALYSPSPLDSSRGLFWGAVPTGELSAFAIPEKLGRGGGWERVVKGLAGGVGW